MLENETKKMEEKLDLVKKMMELEKDKRSGISKSGEVLDGKERCGEVPQPKRVSRDTQML